MCIICSDLSRGALKLDEARRALGEMRTEIGAKHAEEVERAIELARKLAEAEAMPPLGE